MSNERGNGKLGVLVWLLVVGAAVFFAVRTIPAKVAAYEFNDFCEQEVRRAATRGQFSEKVLLESILEKADEVGIEVDRKQIVIRNRTRKIEVDISYELPIDLEVYTWVWTYRRHYESLRL